MSVRVMDRVFWADGFTSTETLVMLAIGDTANDRGFGFLLIGTIAKKTKLAPRTVQATIAKLCAGTAPILEKRERHNRSSIFRIYVDRIPQLDRTTSDREFSIEEMWGESPAPHEKGRGESTAPRGESDDIGVQSDSPITVSIPSPNHNPPLPSEEATPTSDLLSTLKENSAERQALVVAMPSLMEHVRDRWDVLADSFPRIPRVKVWSDGRKKKIARRADEVVRASAGVLNAYQVWDMIFAAIRADPWLRGDAEPGRGYDRAYVVEIDHVLRTGGNPNFLRILEKAATNEHDHRLTHDPRTGRQMGPAEQATRAALERLRAARQ